MSTPKNYREGHKYDALKGDQRYEVAQQLARQAGLDVSQVLFAYLKITATMAAQIQNDRQRAIAVESQFEAFLAENATDKDE